MTYSDNLIGSSSDNIVDSQGYLTPAYQSFVGSRGHQIKARPLPPTGLNLN